LENAKEINVSWYTDNSGKVGIIAIILENQEIIAGLLQ
jgi:hypothetical protein